MMVPISLELELQSHRSSSPLAIGSSLVALVLFLRGAGYLTQVLVPSPPPF